MLQVYYIICRSNTTPITVCRFTNEALKRKAIVTYYSLSELLPYQDQLTMLDISDGLTIAYSKESSLAEIINLISKSYSDMHNEVHKSEVPNEHPSDQ